MKVALTRGKQDATAHRAVHRDTGDLPVNPHLIFSHMQKRIETPVPNVYIV